MALNVAFVPRLFNVDLLFLKNDNKQQETVELINMSLLSEIFLLFKNKTVFYDSL